MLSKLIGHEFKATRRIFLPAYGVVLILSILNGIFMALPSNLDHITMPFGVLLTVYILAMFAICVLTFAYMISRFYKNLLGDEGYLMFTLPARPSELIWAKCMTSTLWILLTAIVCCISLFILVVPAMITAIPAGGSFILDGTHVSLIQYLFHIVREIWNIYGVHMILMPLVFILIALIWIANFCMHIYACLSIGSLANKHRLGFSFLAYLGFGVLSEILLMIFATVSDAFPTITFDLPSLSDIAQIYLTILVIAIYYLIKLGVNFVISNYILSKHLNLQ
ncbi:MAG: hypothetical protein Q4D42_01025 [Eubacteriales bacterium]|nr:hypothetical protein [Eubacteriales bacterium]